MLTTVIVIIVAYLLGSIPSAILTCRLLGLPDPRHHGSQNPGATNVLRVGGKTAGLITLVLDILKGAAAVMMAQQCGLSNAAQGYAGLAAVWGHLFPLFTRFKGGKGVATALGALWAISLINALITTLTWLVLAAQFRYASLASIASALLAALMSLWLGQGTLGIVLIAGLILWRHQDNIARLRAGTENKIND